LRCSSITAWLCAMLLPCRQSDDTEPRRPALRQGLVLRQQLRNRSGRSGPGGSQKRRRRGRFSEGSGHISEHVRSAPGAVAALPQGAGA
jgi:hypothetical protein